MVALRSATPPPTPWARGAAQPIIHETAYVHSFSNIVGEVHVGPDVLIASGTSIRADEGVPFHIGAGSSIQDGVIIHGLDRGRVLGDDGKEYSVWIGDGTSITHMALVHGPAYIGEGCFIGFRSTLFNARVGRGSVVMMHVLIQDVEIPPGKYVPSGSVITTQQQADRLPDVQAVDGAIASQFSGNTTESHPRPQDSSTSRKSERSTQSLASVTPIRYRREPVASATSSSRSSQSSEMLTSRLNPDTVDQVRQMLAQGYRVATEHADTRRFQTSSWHSCAPIQTNRENEVLRALEDCMAEHTGEYVRLYGVDTKSKRRVGEVIIQRPGDAKNGASSSYSSSSSHSSGDYSSHASSGSSSRSSGHAAAVSGVGRLAAEVVERIRALLNQGCRIGAEHADARRFQTSWESCTPLQATREGEVLAAVEACLAEHGGEYVRIFGIDKNRSRVGEMTVQRPGDKPAKPSSGYSSSSYSSSSSNGNGGYSGSSSSSGYGSPSSASSYGSSSGGGSGSGRLSGEVVDQVRQLLSQGYRVAAEHADKRRFQISSWHTCAPITSTRENEVMAEIEACMRENAGEYVRVYGVDTKSKRRVSETIVQRPGR